MKIIVIILGAALILVGILNLVKPDEKSDKRDSKKEASGFDLLNTFINPLTIVTDLFVLIFCNNIGLVLIGFVILLVGSKI